MNDRTIQVLLVEDNPGDVDLTREAMKESSILNEVQVVGDGKTALEYLRGGDSGRPRPDLILLDLNLPRRSGQEVLAEIKADPSLWRIPVIILTASEAERDIRQCYDHHANCYVTKPADLKQFLEVVRKIETFWMGISKLSAA